MSDEHPETCPNCHAPLVWCKCLEELESLVTTLQSGVSNESNLTLILSDIESTSDDLLTYPDGDVAAKVYGNMGLGIDAETYARYLALCATLMPSLLKERKSIEPLGAVQAEPFAGAVMTSQEWRCLSAKARHNLNLWAIKANRNEEELERAQDKLERIADVCKTQGGVELARIVRILTESDATPGDIRQVVEGMKRAVDHE